MTTGGGFVLRLSQAGFSRAKPRIVGNHKVPSALRHGPGCEPEVHSVAGRPSVSPYTRHETSVLVSSASRFSSSLFRRMRPALEPIHK